MLAEVILQMRIYAIYDKSVIVLYLMLACFGVCSTASAIIMGLNLRQVRAIAVDVPGGKFCDGLTVLPHFFSYWIPLLSFDSLLCILALIHGYRDYKNSSRDIEPLKYFDQQRLSKILIRDSIIYFLAIGAVYLASLVVWILDHNPLIEAPIGFSIAISSAFGSRLILNLREADEKHASQYSSDNIASPVLMIEHPS
ncbi:hypothetical protein CPB84DRAFT_876277 [Gymnopilus junonius]|uniref:Uncharacterized protein n=1 Tax=Gymnopilus junonius TaxID=109634 RepID=A0A9P5NSE0_GYMJU|nr:hypothetical protein CPB84DRAFT_876277 [Gymnopilus junonius]